MFAQTGGYIAGLTRTTGGGRLRFYKGAYCTAFSGPRCHAAPARAVNRHERTSSMRKLQ